ncbi:MAG: hypothetical protein H6976_08790 [Gammaproteobacteria bacterium]|nr:hypothetical protein [Gammaproteobacteria bacterium]
MAFIVLFVIGALAVPLSFEIYQRGKDNLLVRSLEDIHEIIPFSGVGRAASSLADNLKGIFYLIVALVVALFALKLLLLIIFLLFS